MSKLIISFVLIFQLNLLYALSYDVDKISYSSGDKIRISWCSIDGWCKVKMKNHFVRKYRLEFFSGLGNNSIYKVNSIKEVYTYTYIDNKTIRHNNKLFDYISRKISLPSNQYIKADFEFGFTRSDIIKDWLEKNRKEIKENRSIVKIEPKPNIVIAPKVEVKIIDIPKAKKEITPIVKKEPIKKIVVKQSSPIVFISNPKFFVLASIGYSKLKVNSSVSSAILVSDALDNTAFIYDFGLGYRYDKSIFTTVNIARIPLDMVDITNFYLTINHQWVDIVYNPYIGGLLGFSEIVYTNNPILNTTSKDIKGTNYLVGMQVGIDKKIEKNIKGFIQYQIIKLNHKSNINATTSIEHNWQNNLFIGLRCDF